MPVADVTPGMTGTGLTAVSGDTPESFDVEILGVLNDAIVPGVDLIMVEGSGPLIDETGGIAAGFSGSPVTVGGKLLGAISYGFYFADQRIAGVTPAEQMIPLFDRPELASARPESTIELTPRLRTAVAAELGVQQSVLPSSMERLPAPVTVSGLGSRAMTAMQNQADERGTGLVLYRGGSASPPSPADPDPPPLEPGQPFATVLSYGDVTFAGIGTTTAVCGNLLLGWGHPFFWQGDMALGLHNADVITVVEDPSHAFGPFKLANLAEAHGVVDQDRIAGLRGIEGATPANLIPITSHFENRDLGSSRDGETTAITQGGVAGFFNRQFGASFFSLVHTMSNIDSVFDEWWDGTSIVEWTIEGTRKNGSPFQLEFDNMYWDNYYLSWYTASRLSRQVGRIGDNPRASFDGIEVDAVHIEGEVTAEKLTANIIGIESSSSLQPAMTARNRVRVRAGSTLSLRVILKTAAGAEESVDLDIEIPNRASGQGPLVARGYCYFGGYCPAPSFIDSENLAELLHSYRNQPRNNEVRVSLFPGGGLYAGGLAQEIVDSGYILSGRRAITVKVVG